MSADEFNAAAESFYRNKLKNEQMRQALDLWREKARQLDNLSNWRSGKYNRSLFSTLKGRDAAAFIDTQRSAVLSEDLPVPALTRLIHLMLLTLDHMQTQCEAACTEERPT